jgi:hypothetical protein
MVAEGQAGTGEAFHVVAGNRHLLASRGRQGPKDLLIRAMLSDQLVRGLDAQTGQVRQVVAAGQQAHVKEHVLCPPFEIVVFVQRQVSTLDLLRAPFLVQFKEHAGAAVGECVRVFADDKVHHAFSRQIGQLRVCLVRCHHVPDVRFLQALDQFVGHFMGDNDSFLKQRTCLSDLPFLVHCQRLGSCFCSSCPSGEMQVALGRNASSIKHHEWRDPILLQNAYAFHTETNIFVCGFTEHELRTTCKGTTVQPAESVDSRHHSLILSQMHGVRH